ERQRFLLAEAPQDERIIYARYNAQGGVRQVTHPDLGGTTTHHGYDRRGLPERVFTAEHAIARQERNPAGLVIRRHNRFDAGPWHLHLDSWTYDPLGRLSQHQVAVTRNRGPPVPVAAQVHSYYDSGDTAAIDELVDTSRRQFRFTYDGRGQLLGASDGIGYAAEYAYSPGGRLLSANVNG